MLEQFISLHRDEIVRRCRAKVATRSTPPPTKLEIDHGVPLFLGQLIDALHHRRSSTPEIASAAVLHGHELLSQGFTVSQVVHDYGDVCQAITELAMEKNAAISASDFQVLNGCLDNAIAGAVTEFGREREHSPVDRVTSLMDEHRTFSTQILRNLIQTALVAFEAVEAGTVGIGGSTGAVVHRSLVGALDLIDRSLVPEDPIAAGIKKRT